MAISLREMRGSAIPATMAGRAMVLISLKETFGVFMLFLEGIH